MPSELKTASLVVTGTLTAAAIAGIVALVVESKRRAWERAASVRMAAQELALAMQNLYVSAYSLAMDSVFGEEEEATKTFLPPGVSPRRYFWQCQAEATKAVVAMMSSGERKMADAGSRAQMVLRDFNSSYAVKLLNGLEVDVNELEEHEDILMHPANVILNMVEPRRFHRSFIFRRWNRAERRHQAYRDSKVLQS